MLPIQPIDHPEDRLDQRSSLIPPIPQFGQNLVGLALRLQALRTKFSSFLLPTGVCFGPLSLQTDGERFLFGGGRLLLPPRLLDARSRDFGAGGALGQDRRQFLPRHARDCARRKRACGAQIGEILQRVSVKSVTFDLEPIDRDDPEVRRLYADFVREADGPLVYDREEAGVDLEEEIAKGPPQDLVPPNGLLLLARGDGKPAGLGGVRYLDTEIAEVKSMYVAPAFRGTGLGRQILARLDQIALERGCRAVRLDTSDYLTPAVGLYRSAGYEEVPAYNENPKADLWFERALQQDD